MFCMESKVVDVYSMYNSTINDGRRIRRMRRTQLSAQKVEKGLSAKRGSNTKLRSHEKQTSNSYSKSRPKIQPKWGKDNQTQSKASHRKIVQNQYYNECTVNVSEFQRNNNKQSNQRISLTNRKNNQTDKLDKSEKKNGVTNAENSYGQIMKINSSLSRRKNQGYKSDKQQSQLSGKHYVNLQPYKIQQVNTSKRSVSKRSQQSREKIKYSITQQKAQKKEEKSLINQYGLKSKLQKDEKKSIEPSQKYPSYRHSSIKQSSIRQESNLVPKPASQINKNRNTQVPIRLKAQKSKQSIKKQSQIQVIPNQSNLSSPKQSLIEKNIDTAKKSAQFYKRNQKLSNQFQSAISKNLHSNKSSRISKQNFSKLRDPQKNPIINSSGPRQELFKETIQSLDIVKIKNQIKNDTQKHDNQRESNIKDSRKIELKLESDREDMNSSIAKFKYLPLASKEFSGRRSIDSLSIKTTQPGTLKAFLENVQIHDLLIDMLADLKQQILYFNQGVDNPDHEVLAYLLQKKHMYQKSLVTKTLRGLQRNVFNTSTAQIQKEQLKKYLGKEQVKSLITTKQKQNMTLFKQLETKYFEMRQKNKNNPFIKLQNKVDDYSKQIIRRLEQYYNDLFKKFTQTNSNFNQQEQTQTLENRIFNVMEVAFLICELSGKRIKKTEFFQDINDIDQYFEEYQEILQEVFQYFRTLN